MIKMNKKGFIARDYIVATILFSGFLTLMIMSIGSLANDYDNPNVVDEDFSNNFNNFEETTQNAQDIYGSAKNGEGISFLGSFDVLFSSTFTIFALIFNAVSSTGTQLLGFSEFFGIDSGVAGVFFTILLSILSVIIVFIIISSVSRRDL